MLREVAAQSAFKEAEIAALREALQQDRTFFEAQKARIAAAMPPCNQRVKLNVGDVYFETSRATWTRVPDSMLGRTFGRCDLMLQADPDDGSIFIDHSGDRFGLILDFLRGGDASHVARTIRAVPEANQVAIMQELDDFGLEAAVFPVPWFKGAPSTFDIPSLCTARDTRRGVAPSKFESRSKIA
jgi:hypothetical protein